MTSRHYCSAIRWPSAASSATQPPISPDPITHPTSCQSTMGKCQLAPSTSRTHLINSRTTPSLHNDNHPQSIYILNQPPSDLRISLSQHSPTAAFPQTRKIINRSAADKNPRSGDWLAESSRAGSENYHPRWFEFLDPAGRSVKRFGTATAAAFGSGDCDDDDASIWNFFLYCVVLIGSCCFAAIAT